METSMEVPLVDPMTGEDLGIRLVRIVDLVLDGEDMVRPNFLAVRGSDTAVELGWGVSFYLMKNAPPMGTS